MWLWGEQWEEKEKKKKKKSRPFHAGPRSFTDARHSSIGFPLESSGPSSGTRDDNHNRETARISDSVLLRSTLNFASFLPFFFFFANRKNAKKGKKEKRVEAYFRATRSWNRGIASLLVTSYIFSLENREGMVRVATLETPLPLSLPLPLSRGIYEREKVSRSCNVSRASSMESRFLKGSGMGETREIFNRNRLDP